MKPHKMITTVNFNFISVVIASLVFISNLMAADPSIVIAVTRNGQPVSEGQTVSGTVNITVTVTNGVGMHVAPYGNMIFLPFNEPGHRADTPVWSHTTQVDTRRFYDGENLLSVHVHPHNHPGETYIADFTFGTFKLVSQNSNPAPNGDRLLPTLSIGTGWTPTVSGGESYLSGDASVVDDKTSSGVGRSSTTAAPVQIIAHLGESVLGRFRWNSQTPPFGDESLVQNCHLRPFQRDQAFNTKVVFFFTDGAGRANYATRAFSMPALPTIPAVDLPKPFLDAKILGLGDGGTLRVPDSGTTPLYVQVSNLAPGVWTYPEMTTWIGNRAVKVTNLFPYLRTLPEGATSVIVEVPIPADEVQRLQAARQGGEMSTATPIWVDFNQSAIPCLPVSSHIHLNSVRTTSYPWPYGAPTVVIQKPWNNSAHWTGTTLVARYDQWGPLPSGYRVRWKLNSGTWQVDDGDGLISLSGLARQSHLLEIELTDAAFVRLPGGGSLATVNFITANRAPIPLADTKTVTAGTQLLVPAPGVLINDSDLEGDSLVAQLVTQPRHGTVTMFADGSFNYIPVVNFTGMDRFTYRVNDGFSNSSSAEVRIQVVSPVAGANLTGDWRMLGKDEKHSSYFPGTIGTGYPNLSWVFSLPNTNPLGFAVQGNRVIISVQGDVSQNGIVSLNATTGVKQWFAPYDGGLSAPAIDNGMVYVQRSGGWSNSYMLALDLSNGSERWKTQYLEELQPGWGPTVAEGKVWASRDYYSGLHGYDAFNGNELFFTSLPHFKAWTPAYQSGNLFTWMQGTVRQHNPLTGIVKKQRNLIPAETTNGTANTMPVLSENKLLLRDDNRLIACSPDDLSVFWEMAPGDFYWKHSPLVCDGLVYAPKTTGIDVLDLATGRLVAVIAAPLTYSWAPIITDDTIIVSFTDQQIGDQTRIIDRATFQTRYTIPVAGTIAISDNALYILGYTSQPVLLKYSFGEAPPPNSPPIANADQFIVPEGGTLVITSIQMLANDSDADGNALTVGGIITQPTHGSLITLSNGFLYASWGNWTGTDTFTYFANDGLSDSSAATVTINVTSTQIQDPLVTYKPGLLAEFFDYTTALTAIPALNGRIPEVTRTDNQIAYASVTTAWAGLPTTMVDTFASRHSGWLKVDTAGSYTVFIKSDDGSRLFLNGALVINNDGLHGMRERSAVLTLPAGYHRLMVEFFEGTGGAGLEFRWSGPGIAKQLVPASALWQAGDPPLYRAGLQAEFFDYVESLSFIPDLSSRVAEVKRTDSQINYPNISTAWTGLPTTMADTFASRHGGWLKVDTQGSYTLYLRSNEGSKLYLNGQMLINNDGLHDTLERSVTLNLAPGFHKLRVEFFENTGSAGLSFRWSGPGISKRLVPASALWHTPAGVIGVPPPWISGTVGMPAITGSAVGNGADFSISGGGSGIGGTADSFHFVYQPLTSNGEMIARVAALQNTNSLAMAGVMIRTSTLANSANVFMSLTPTSGAAFQSRTASAATTSRVLVSGKKAPHWVRLVRIGTSITGWISSDGTTWTQVGAAVTLPLGATPVIGLGVTSTNNATRALAIFDQVIFIPHTGG